MNNMIKMEMKINIIKKNLVNKKKIKNRFQLLNKIINMMNNKMKKLKQRTLLINLIEDA